MLFFSSVTECKSLHLFIYWTKWWKIYHHLVKTKVTRCFDRRERKTKKCQYEQMEIKGIKAMKWQNHIIAIKYRRTNQKCAGENSSAFNEQLSDWDYIQHFTETGKTSKPQSAQVELQVELYVSMYIFFIHNIYYKKTWNVWDSLETWHTEDKSVYMKIWSILFCFVRSKTHSNYKKVTQSLLLSLITVWH